MLLTNSQRQVVIHSRLVAAFLLFLALFPLGRDFDLLIKILVSVISILNVVAGWNRKHLGTLFWFILFALLFNPIFSLRLAPSVWLIFEIAGVFIFWFSWWRRW